MRMLLLAGSMPRASNGQTRIPLVATLPWFSTIGYNPPWMTPDPQCEMGGVCGNELHSRPTRAGAGATRMDATWVRFRRGSLRNGYHIQGRQQARKLPNPDTGSWTLGWVDRSASGVHRSGRPFCRRCAPGLNWPGRASGAVTLKKLECSKQAYALDTLAWDNTTGF
ncbi:hypothetical protein VNO80_35423 [Phaseolus coccineus]|uniref:Uncharacterized protein n=1 Tax=Phaseolus coccineus TaxID=3886 RepID=A0AAN9Q8I9_PHACN